VLEFDTLVIFFLSCFVLCITPGPSIVYVLSRSVGQGRSAGVYSALGLAAGNLFHAVAAGLGLSFLLVYSPIAFLIVKILGALYLIYLGIRVFFSHQNLLQPQKASSKKKDARIFSQGFLIEVLNPKAALFFISFLPQFVDASKGSPALQMFVLGCIFLLTALPVDLSVAITGGTIAKHLMHYSMVEKAQRWLSGTVLIGLGLRLAFSERG